MHSYNNMLHALLAKKALTQQKTNLVESFSNGRTTSSRELTDGEARELCNWLQGQPTPSKVPAVVAGHQPDALQRQRRKIIAIAHNMGWKTKEGKADMPRINAWCLQQFGKCPLNGYTAQQLPTLVSVFEKVYNQFLKAI
jgi:hypothetical protein